MNRRQLIITAASVATMSGVPAGFAQASGISPVSDDYRASVMRNVAAEMADKKQDLINIVVRLNNRLMDRHPEIFQVPVLEDTPDTKASRYMVNWGFEPTQDHIAVHGNSEAVESAILDALVAGIASELTDVRAHYVPIFTTGVEVSDEGQPVMGFFYRVS